MPSRLRVLAADDDLGIVERTNRTYALGVESCSQPGDPELVNVVLERLARVVVWASWVGRLPTVQHALEDGDERTRVRNECEVAGPWSKSARPPARRAMPAYIEPVSTTKSLSTPRKKA